MSIIQEDCFFFQQKADDGKDYMKAACIPCQTEDHQGLGWFWKGSERGYGDYDLECYFCGRQLHQRDEDYEEPT